MCLHSETPEERNDTLLLFLDVTDSFKIDFTGGELTCPLGTVPDHSTYLNRVFKPCSYWVFFPPLAVPYPAEAAFVEYRFRDRLLKPETPLSLDGGVF